MTEIKVIKNPDEKQLKDLDVFTWPIWTKEASVFPWAYGDSETCYFLEGDVIVTPDGGDPVFMGKGDLVIFPQNLTCTWEIKKDVRKHYKFG